VRSPRNEKKEFLKKRKKKKKEKMYFPDTTTVIQQAVAAVDRDKTAYLQSNAAWLMRQVTEMVHFSDIISLSLLGRQEGDWKTYTVYIEPFDRLLCDAMNARGFSCIFEPIAHPQKRTPTILMQHPMRKACAPTSLALPDAFSASFTGEQVAAAMFAAQDKASCELRTLLMTKYTTAVSDIAKWRAEHPGKAYGAGSTDSIVVPADGWLAYCMPSEVQSINTCTAQNGGITAVLHDSSSSRRSITLSWPPRLVK
jgi:hypothetical protein